MSWIARWGPPSLLIAIGTAIFVQDFTDVLPLRLFNQKREQYTYLAHACLIVTVLALVILIGEARWGKRWRVAGIVRMGLFCFIVVELFVFGIDRMLVSQTPQNGLGGPYYEKRTANGNWVILRKSHAGSPFGFRTDHPYERVPDRPRILFLGDSYSEGSGRSSACNYPDIVEEVLREQLGDVEVMNAGVAGYGPVDTLNLLELLREEGFHFDALVYNVFAENDFTDNLPGTERRVVGGIIFRFPSNEFLRSFHPLNSYLFRYLLVIWRLGTLSAGERNAFSLESGDCIFHQRTPADVSPHLRDLIHQRLKGSQRVVQSLRAQEEFIKAITAMDAEANKLGIPFIIVLFPDRVIVDQELRDRLNLGEEQLASPRRLSTLVYQAVPDSPVVEVATELQSRSGMFRAGDTHLSDLGNKIAGSYVGKELVGLLTKTGFGGP
jgi:hypothetical protein